MLMCANGCVRFHDLSPFARWRRDPRRDSTRLQMRSVWFWHATLFHATSGSATVARPRRLPEHATRGQTTVADNTQQFARRVAQPLSHTAKSDAWRIHRRKSNMNQFVTHPNRSQLCRCGFVLTSMHRSHCMSSSRAWTRTVGNLKEHH